MQWNFDVEDVVLDGGFHVGFMEMGWKFWELFDLVLPVEDADIPFGDSEAVDLI
jgi:hypothetical protein